MSLTTKLYRGEMEKDAREFRDKQVGVAKGGWSQWVCSGGGAGGVATGV